MVGWVEIKELISVATFASLTDVAVGAVTAQPCGVAIVLIAIRAWR